MLIMNIYKEASYDSLNVVEDTVNLLSILKYYRNKNSHIIMDKSDSYDMLIRNI